MPDQLIQDYNNTVVPNANIPAGQAGSPWVTPNGKPSPQPTPNVELPKSIDSTMLGNSTPVSIPTPPPSTPPAPQANLANSALQQLTDKANADAQDTSTEKTADNLSQAIYNLVPQLEGQSQALANEKKNAGVDTLQSDLNDLNGQILDLQAKNAQSDTQLIADQRAVEMKDTLLPFAQSDQAKLAGDAAITRALNESKIGVLNAQVLAKQGSLTLALQKAQDAVDLKYAPIKEQIQTYQSQLDALAPILSKDEAKQAEARTLQNNLALKKIDDEAAQAKQNVSDAITVGTTSKFVNRGGVFFDTQTGEEFTDPANFFKAAGIAMPANPTDQDIQNGFNKAYQMGLVTDLDNEKLQDAQFALQAQAHYDDVRIPSNSTPEQVAQIVKSSRIYQKENYIAPPSGSFPTGITGNVPDALAPYAHTSYSGIGYVDLSGITASTLRNNLAQLATQSGLQVIFNTGDASKVNAIADAKTNLQNISDSLKSINLGGQGGGNIASGVKNQIAGLLGDADVKSYNAWRTAIINNVQALAGGAGSGLRINKAEIDAALQNDLPVISGYNADTPDSAQAKLSKLNSQLDTWETQILGGGNQASNNTISQSDGSVWQDNGDGTYTRIK